MCSEHIPKKILWLLIIDTITTLISLISLPRVAGCWEIVTQLWEASGPASLWGLHPRRNNHLRASHPGTRRCEGIDHERGGVCHWESQGAWPKVGSRKQEMMAPGCLLITAHRTWVKPDDKLTFWLNLMMEHRDKTGLVTLYFCFYLIFPHNKCISYVSSSFLPLWLKGFAVSDKWILA